MGYDELDEHYKYLNQDKIKSYEDSYQKVLDDHERNIGNKFPPITEYQFNQRKLAEKNKLNKIIKNVPSELKANLESTMQLKLNCVRLSDEIEVIRFVNDEKICRENIINIQQIDLGEEGFSWVLWYMKMQKINKDEL